MQAAGQDARVNPHGAEMVGLLLAGEADVDGRLPHTQTALAAASEVGNVTAVKTLLGSGASSNVIGRPQRRTALHWAAAELQSVVVRALIDAGAESALVDAGGRTARGLVEDHQRVRHLPLVGRQLRD